MTKVTTSGITLSPKKKDQIIIDVENCLKDSLKKNQEITEISIKVKETN